MSFHANDQHRFESGVLPSPPMHNAGERIWSFWMPTITRCPLGILRAYSILPRNLYFLNELARTAWHFVYFCPLFNDSCWPFHACSTPSQPSLGFSPCPSAGGQLTAARVDEGAFKTKLEHENARQLELARSLEQAYTKIIAAGLDLGVSNAP